MTPPRYQSITSDGLRLLTSDDGGALVRLIAGDLAGFAGPGVTHTPITYAHVTLAPGRRALGSLEPRLHRLRLRPHRPRHRRARSDVRSRATSSSSSAPAIASSWPPPSGQAEPLDVLLLGGLPIRAPIVHYGPFVMNTREEILQAIEDYQAGRLGTIPADQLVPRNFA